MARTHPLAGMCALVVPAFVCLLVFTHGACQAQVTTGTVKSVDAFAQIKRTFLNRAPLGERAAFAYCVCKDDRGVIVYAYSMADTTEARIDAACRSAASACGGCFKPPVTSRPMITAELRKTWPIWLTQDDRGAVPDFNPPPGPVPPNIPPVQRR